MKTRWPVRAGISVACHEPSIIASGGFLLPSLCRQRKGHVASTDMHNPDLLGRTVHMGKFSFGLDQREFFPDFIDCWGLYSRLRARLSRAFWPLKGAVSGRWRKSHVLEPCRKHVEFLKVYSMTQTGVFCTGAISLQVRWTHAPASNATCHSAACSFLQMQSRWETQISP